MRPSLAVVAAVAFVGALSPRSPARGDPAPGADVERAARELDDPRWEVRRAATEVLLVDGRAALAEIADDSGPAPLVRLERWLKAVEERVASGSPTAAGRARAVLAVVEEEASTEAVKGSSLLLRARLRRLLPMAAVDSPEDDDEEGAFDSERGDRFDTARNARTALGTLLPEARPLLLATVAASRDAATLAGALSLLAGDDGNGPDDEVTAAVATRYSADARAIDGVRRFATPGSSIEATTVVALSLALAGRPAEATRFDRANELAAPLRRRLAERHDADLTTGAFLDEVSEGRATAADAEEAARRLAGLGLPQFARLAARRALFLDAANERARRVLVDADVALGLLETARKDASAATPAPAGAATEDAPAARALDDALRAGRFADRLAWRKEVGSTPLFGTPPVAIGEGVVACGRTDGRVMLLDPATGDERVSVRTAPVARDPRDGMSAKVPRGLAIAKGRLAALSSRGRLFLWSLSGTPEAPLSETAGPFDFVAAGADGTFWVASAGRRIHRVAPGATAPEAVSAVPFSPDVVPTALHVLSDGSLVLHTGSSLERIEPATGAVTEILAGVAGMASAPYGEAVLFGLGSTWGTIRGGRLSRGGRAPDDGEIVGLAGDPAAGVVYLTLPSETVAVRATDGEVLWRRGVEGSGNPVLGPGLLVVPAGSGGEDGGGGGRADRTLFALTTSRPPSDLFSEATIARVLAAATAAVQEGRIEVGVLMLDPVRDWVGDGRPAFDAAVLAARLKADPAAAKEDGEDEPAPEPAPEPPPVPPPAPPAPEPAPDAPPAPKPGAGR